MRRAGVSVGAARRPLRPCVGLSVGLGRRACKARAAQGNEDDLLAACPVPRDQQPMQELLQIQNAFLFDWPRLSTPEFALRLSGVFAGMFVFIGLPISVVTFNPQDELLQVIASSAIGSGFITLVLVLRLYLGYSHVSSRLLSATVEYEETGWYDGQIWVKTPQMLMRDRLLGTYQVKPTLERLKTALLGLSGAMAAATVLLVTAPPPKAYSANDSTFNPASSNVAWAPAPQSRDDDYWQRVEEYEPWATDVDSDGTRPVNLLSHMKAPQLE